MSIAPATTLGERIAPGTEDFIRTRFWWVRHAPVVTDNGCIYGQRDLPCDCSNQEVFNALAQVLPGGAAWVTSNLQRTHQTAAAILAAGHPDAGKVAPRSIADLAEQNLGDWQGLNRAEFFKTRKPSPGSYWFGPADERAPNGESFADLCARVRNATTALAKEFAGRDVIAVTHGGTIRAAIGMALDLEPQRSLSFGTENCAITRLDLLDSGTEQGWRVVVVNNQPWFGASPTGGKLA